MLKGSHACVFFQIFYMWLFLFWVAESCVHIIKPYFLLEKSFRVWMIELNMSVFHGISQRKLRLLGVAPSKPLWKPGGCPGAGWQMETRCFVCTAKVEKHCSDSPQLWSNLLLLFASVVCSEDTWYPALDGVLSCSTQPPITHPLDHHCEASREKGPIWTQEPIHSLL